jgi:hypothetical protein
VLAPALLPGDCALVNLSPRGACLRLLHAVGLPVDVLGQTAG